MIFHVLNRGVRRSRIFDSDGDYALFERLVDEARTRFAMRVLAFCVMPTHFHLVLWPERDRQLSSFMHWLTGTHTQRWHALRQTSGTGALYQGRYKSFPIQEGSHFLRVCRYVERNALRAGLCQRAEDWRWCSLWHRCKTCDGFPLDPWPIQPPSNWAALVNQPMTEAEVAAVRRCVRRGAPCGDPAWVARLAGALQLESTLHPRGRPTKKGVGSLFSQS